MGEARYEGRLFGDISAITLRNRQLSTLRQLIEQDDWHPRLQYGTDYPLPGIHPLDSQRRLTAEKMLPDAAVPVLETLRDHHPLLFDLVLKRQLHAGRRHLAASIFETRRFFDRKPA
jgi:mannonate dehydratase